MVKICKGLYLGKDVTGEYSFNIDAKVDGTVTSAGLSISKGVSDRVRAGVSEWCERVLANGPECENTATTNLVKENNDLKVALAEKSALVEQFFKNVQDANKLNKQKDDMLTAQQITINTLSKQIEELKKVQPQKRSLFGWR